MFRKHSISKKSLSLLLALMMLFTMVIPSTPIFAATTLTLSTNSWAAPKNSFGAGVSVYSNTSWTATSSATSWLTVYPPSGSNNGMISLSTTSNTEVSSRTGYITVTGGGIAETITVTQAGTGGGEVASLTLSTSSWASNAIANNTSVSVTSNVSWLATSNDPSWLTVSPASGTNNGSLTLTATANTSTLTRSATITVTGGGITKTIAVTQAGAAPSFTSLTLNNPALITITNGARCETRFTATSAGSYLFTSSNNGALDPKAYSASSGTAALDDNSAGNNNYQFQATLNAGQTYTYYSGVNNDSPVNGTYNVTVTLLTTTLTLNASTWSPGSGASNYNVAVTSNTSWSATSNAAWLTVSPASGSNNGNVTLNAAANTSTASRTGTITVTGGGITKTIAVTQAGAVPTASLTLSTSELNIGSTANATSVAVTSNVSWTASSSVVSWLTVSPASESNNGALTVSVLANTTTSSRCGTITVTGGGLTKTIAVTQAGIPAANLTLGSSTWSPGSASNSTSVSVTSNVAWTATSNATWLTVSPTSGSGNSALLLNTTANTGASSRTGTITVTGGDVAKAIVVTQAAQAANLTLDISTWSPGYSASYISVSVVSNISWTVTNGTSSWLIVTPSSGLNDGTFDILAFENTGASSRTGTITVTGGGLTRTIIVTQEGVSAPILTLGSSTWAPGPTANATSVAVTSNVTWTVISEAPSWLTVSPAGGSGNGVLVLNVTANTDVNNRTGSITVYNGVITKTISVFQTGTPAPFLSLSSETWSPTDAAAYVMVLSNVSWTATSNDPSWLSVSPVSGTNDAALYPSITTNTSTSSRTGTITITSGGITRALTVTQAGIPAASLTLGSSTWSPGSAANSTSVSVTSNVSWAASSDARSWLTVTPATGSSNGALVLNVTANTGTASRTGTITITGGGVTKTITITQSGANANITLGSTTWSPGLAANSTSVSVNSNVSWIASSSNTSWLTVTPASGSNNGSLLINVTENTDTSSRAGTITVSGDGITKTITVTQAASAANLTLDISTWSPGYDANITSVSVTSNVSWAVIKDASSWLIVTPSSGSNDGAFDILAFENMSANARIGIITVTGGGITKTITVTQEGISSTLALGISNWAPGSASNAIGVSINSSISWMASSSAPSWLTVSPATGSNNGVIVLNITANTSTSSRIGAITVTGGGITKTITVTQGGVSPNLSLGSSTWSPGSAANSIGVSVTSNVSWSATSSNTSWLSVSPASGYNNGNIVITATENTNASSRSATITVTGGGITRTVSVTQGGVTATVTLGSYDWAPGSAANSTSVLVTSNVSWTALSSESWLSVSPVSGSNYLYITVTENTSTSSRTGYITVKGGGITRTIKVTQEKLTTHTIVCDPNNGYWPSSFNNRLVCNDGASIRLFTEKPTRTGYEFLGWSEKAISPYSEVFPAGSIYGATKGITKGITLYAVWNPVGGTLVGHQPLSYGNDVMAYLTLPAAEAYYHLLADDRTYQRLLSAADDMTTVADMIPILIELGLAIEIASEIAPYLIAVFIWYETYSAAVEEYQLYELKKAIDDCRASGDNFVIVAHSPNVMYEHYDHANDVDVIKGLTWTQGFAGFDVSPSAFYLAAASTTQSVSVYSGTSWKAESSDPWLTLKTPSGTGNGSINFSVSQNPKSTSRTATITVTSTIITSTLKEEKIIKKISVTQVGATLDVSPSSFYIAAAVTLQSVIIESNVSWSAESNAAWLNLLTTDSMGNKTVRFIAEQNPYSTSRNAVITITAGNLKETIAVKQAGITSTLSVDTSTFYLAATESKQNTSVSSNTSWTATSNKDWLILTTSNGTGNGRIEFETTENKDPLDREATITVKAGYLTETIKVKQFGAVKLDVNVDAWFSTAQADSRKVTVASNTLWAASSNETSWLSVSPTSGSNDGSFTIYTTANTGTASRTGTITIKAGSFTKEISVTQPAITLYIGRGIWNPTASAESISTSVTTNGYWTASSNATSWLTVSPANGDYNGTLTLKVTANTSTSSRSGTITIKAGGNTETIAVTQAGVAVSLNVSTASWPSAAQADSKKITVTSNVSWAVTSNASGWLSVSPTSGSNDGSFTIYTTANTGTASRTGTITVKGGGVTRTVSVTQPNINLSVVVTSWKPSASADNKSVTVSTNGYWTASSNATSWLTVSPANGDYNGTLTLKVTANTSTASRSGIITIKAGSNTHTISVTQEGVAVSLNVSTASWPSAAQADSKKITVTSNVSWAVTSNASGWLSVSPTSGSNNGSFTIYTTANTGTASRTGTITVKGGGVTRTVSVTQPYINLSVVVTSWKPSASADNKSVTVSTNGYWTASSNATSWLTVSPSNGDHNGTLTIKVTANTGTASRTGTITVKAGSNTHTITVTQAGK